LLQERGITIFCRVDHSGDPEKVGLKIHSTQLFRFASSKVGTPGMIAYPTPRGQSFRTPWNNLDR
jgi:hypothetical protein